MNARNAITPIMLLGSALLLGGCDDPERYVILERLPFFEEKIPYDPNDRARVIASVRRFAKVNGLDFLSGGSSPEGDFNVTAAGRDMNFKVIHGSAIEPNSSIIWVYAQADPSVAQQQRARDFACAVKETCPRS